MAVQGDEEHYLCEQCDPRPVSKVSTSTTGQLLQLLACVGMLLSVDVLFICTDLKPSL